MVEQKSKIVKRCVLKGLCIIENRSFVCVWFVCSERLNIFACLFKTYTLALKHEIAQEL